MSPALGPVVAGKLLTNELVRLRRKAELTQQGVAKDLEWHASKLIRIEGGKTGITKADLQALLALYGVTSQSAVENLQDLSRQSKEAAWWDTYQADASAQFLQYIGYEAAASYIRSYQSTLIPGLLQTERYAEIIADRYVGSVHVGPTVRLRMQRQEEVAKRRPAPRRIFLMDEAAISRHVGISVDPNIMSDQLRHLANIAKNDEFSTIQIVPFKAGAHEGMSASFTLLEFTAELSNVLHLEGGRQTDQTIMDESFVTDYLEAFESIRDQSLSTAQSIELIESHAEEMS